MASSVIGLRKDSGSKVAIVKANRPNISGSENLLDRPIAPALRKFYDFWDLMETIKRHGYIRAAMSTIGRSTVGTWFTFREHEEYKNAAQLHRKKLMDFYYYKNRDWDNIKDFQSLAGKFMIGIMYLRYFGQVGFHILRDENGMPLGFDHLPGLILPNVDETGKFKSPAFYQFLSEDVTKFVAFENPKDVIYITTPDWTGSPLGGTDLESLTNLTLVLDLYLQTSAREYMKNRDKPEVVYQLSPDVSEEGFNLFVSQMQEKYSGASNTGKSMIAVQGDFKVHELRPLPESLPYQDSRKETREEELAVSGVSGAKLGLTENMANANVRENRREFHEATMKPYFRIFEMGLYEQIHVREFNYPDWELAFNQPDFLTAVERATVHMRYRDMGALTPNEIRYDIGKKPRTDEGGDEFVKPDGKTEEEQGSPPEGREDRPDAPGVTGEPTLDDQDPPRGDGHDDGLRESMLKEIRQWRTFALKRLANGKAMRSFRTEFLDEPTRQLIEDKIYHIKDVDGVKNLFDDLINVVERT